MALMEIEQDGLARKITDSYYRGASPNLLPYDVSLNRDDVLSEYMVKGWMPQIPFLDHGTPTLVFGASFAAEMRWYLAKKGFNIVTETKGHPQMFSTPEGAASPLALLRHLEWAWAGKVPASERGEIHPEKNADYTEPVRIRTRAILKKTDCFIITLGLAEIGYDEPTGEVLWRAISPDVHDPSRHKFRVATFAEIYDSVANIHRQIRRHRPDSAIIFHQSPVPLQATFRPVSCLTANSVSQGLMRAAFDQVHREQLAGDAGCFYFPSYEVITGLFHHPWTDDRRTLYPHVANFNMALFERYYCDTGLTDADVLALFRAAQETDRKIGREGHIPVVLEGEQKRLFRKQTRLNLRSKRRKDKAIKKKEDQRPAPIAKTKPKAPRAQ